MTFSFDQPEDGSLEDILAAIGDTRVLRACGYRGEQPYLRGIAAAAERAQERLKGETK